MRVVPLADVGVSEWGMEATGILHLRASNGLMCVCTDRSSLHSLQPGITIAAAPQPTCEVMPRDSFRLHHIHNNLRGYLAN